MEAVNNVLAKYMFPVTTKKIFIEEHSRNSLHKSAPEYQAIVRERSTSFMFLEYFNYKKVQMD